MEALELCQQAYGEFSVLSSRLLLNIGIMYEDKRDYDEAYNFYIKWQDVCEQVRSSVTTVSTDGRFRPSHFLPTHTTD